jgi:hypothetical protein
LRSSLKQLTGRCKLFYC